MELTPRMVRVEFGGVGLEGFSAGEFTDHYVKIQFPPADADYAAPFDQEEIRVPVRGSGGRARAHTRCAAGMRSASG